jgi:hypothetical protein
MHSGRTWPSNRCGMDATGHQRSTATHAQAPAATLIAAPLSSGGTVALRRAARNASSGPTATKSDNERHLSPGRPSQLTMGSPNAALLPTFHANRPSGARELGGVQRLSVPLTLPCTRFQLLALPQGTAPGIRCAGRDACATPFDPSDSGCGCKWGRRPCLPIFARHRKQRPKGLPRISWRGARAPPRGRWRGGPDAD